jgi:hypothetical protein
VNIAPRRWEVGIVRAQLARSSAAMHVLLSIQIKIVMTVEMPVAQRPILIVNIILTTRHIPVIVMRERWGTLKIALSVETK